MRIINALFDGLTKFHPVTLEPMAALATHFETNSRGYPFHVLSSRPPASARNAISKY